MCCSVRDIGAIRGPPKFRENMVVASRIESDGDMSALFGVEEEDATQQDPGDRTVDVIHAGWFRIDDPFAGDASTFSCRHCYVE
jgi:hypothetical protein